jgi:hypothetical protein
LYRRQSGPTTGMDGCGKSRPTGFFNSLILSLHFFRTCFFVCLSVFTHNTQHKHPCPPGGFEHATPASDGLQIIALDGSATVIGVNCLSPHWVSCSNNWFRSPNHPARSKSLHRLSYPGPRTLTMAGRIMYNTTGIKGIDTGGQLPQTVIDVRTAIIQLCSGSSFCLTVIIYRPRGPPTARHRTPYVSV